jgi:hypothetical protein
VETGTIQGRSAVDFREFIHCLLALKVLVVFLFVGVILVTMVVFIYQLLMSEKFHYVIVVFILFIF